MVVTIGDFVLISNLDSENPDMVEGCDVAQVKKLYDTGNYIRSQVK